MTGCIRLQPRWHRRCALALVVALLGSQGTGAQDAVTARRATAGADADFVRHWTARAQASEAAGRWSDAGDAWEVLSLVRPDLDHVAANLRRAREQARAAAVEFTQRGETSLRKAEVRRAMAYFLAALAALPAHEPAQRALRQLARRHPFEVPSGGAGMPRTRDGESTLRPGPPNRPQAR